MRRPRRGMALLATIGVVSLVAILAVASLSLGGRVVQGSALAMRDARLDAAAGHGLTSALERWRQESLGTLSVGATRALAVTVPGVPVSVGVTVTRLSTELYWIVSESSAADGSKRRENLVVRLQLPDVPAIMAGDSTDVQWLDGLAIDSLTAAADLVIPPGAQVSAPSGVVHALGDLSITGGTGEGILIVRGRLTVLGPMAYRGIVIVRGEVAIASPQVAISGLLRVSGSPPISGTLDHTVSQMAVQDVLLQSLIPRVVAGRSWAELQ